MKSFFISILLTGMFLYGRAQDPVYPAAPALPQNIIAAEYYIDTDPGFGNADAVPVSAGINIPNIPASINVTGLLNGIHQLVLRTKSNLGIWSISSVRDFLYNFDPVYTGLVSAQNIIAAEYFIDTDPGFGNATPIPVTAGLDLNNIPALVSTTGLSNGVHRLCIRSKNNEGHWAVSAIKEFIINFDFNYPASPSIPQNITGAEYFIDTDPGFGNATTITITAALDINNVAALINTTGLSNGTHRLYLRTKNNEGYWSGTQVKEFITDADPGYPVTSPAPQNIIAAEYFINTDPGAGNGTAIAVAAALDISNIAAAVNTSALTPATTNQLFLRIKNNEGFWSITNVKEFVVTITGDPAYPPSPVAAQNITAAEYFINTDPGFGNATVIPVTAALDINNTAVAVNTGSLTPATTNQLFLRTKNNEGFWSVISVKQFTVDITGDPVYPAPPVAAQNITAAEYFINTDPGIGNGTVIPVAAALEINNIPVAVNSSSLTPATTNQLYLRTRNNEGRWSITNVKEFVVSITGDPAYAAAPTAPQNIVAAEYFTDTDPGIGSGIAISLSAAVNISNMAVAINTVGLSNGLHSLFVRTKNNEGRWSISNVASFYTDLLALSADSLLFGNVPLNTSSLKNIIVTNNSNVNQTINAVLAGAPFTSNFTTQRTIAPGAKDTIVVNFTPTVAGVFIQGLQLQTSAGNYNAGLNGTGVTQVPSWTITPATGHDYGNVPVSTTANFSFTIQNTGNVPATLSNVTTTNAAFVPSFTTGTIIPVNGSITLPVAFNPPIVNQYSAQVRIESSTPGVNFVTAAISGRGFNAGAPPVLQFVTGTPYNAVTGVNPSAGQVGNYTYKILYKSSNNRAPESGSPRLSVDLTGDQDFTDLNEGTFTMIKETPGTDYVNGVVYAYTYTHLNNSNTAGYKFSATDDNGNAASSINTNYVSGPTITDQQLDLRIFANDISFSKSNPSPGETFTVFAKITNSTALPASNIPVKFYRDTILIDSDVIPAVNAFSSTTISRTLTFAAEGFYPIKVWIDSSNTIPDINPLNNYAIRPVIVGSPNLPGGILVTTNAVMQQCPQVKVFISGFANYFGTGSPTVVAGAEVTINTGTQTITTTTNAAGYYSYLLTGVTCGGSFTYNVRVTDFTFTSSLVTNAIALPCPAANACTPPPSLGGAAAFSSSNPCSNIAGGTGPVVVKLKYRERNLANFWNGFDQIVQDTLRVFQDGVLIQTIGSADYSHGPGNEVTVPINVPLSAAATVVTATLTYVYVEYLQIPSSIYFGNFIPMTHTGGTTINPVPNQPDLTLESFAQTSFTSFSFRNVNIKCVAAGAHTVKIYDSIPGGTMTLIDTRSVASLAANSGINISYSDPTISSGTHFIKVVTDADGTVPETNEGNNVFTFILVVPPSELTVTEIAATPTALSTGSSTSFTATIKNTGRRTGGFVVRFRANGVQIGAVKNISFLNENTSVTVVSDPYIVTNASSDCGASIEAFADANSQVIESNETNNSRQTVLGADLAPYQISGQVGSASNPAVVRVFTTNQFYPAIRNIGERDASDVTVRFRLAGNWIGADTIGNVKAGEVFASFAAFTRMFTVAGDYVVKVTADTANSICESVETNNEGDFFIRVVESKPDLEVLSQYISPSSLNPNIAQGITLVGTVKNMGGKVTTPSILRFMVDDIQLGADVPIDAILPGRDTTVAATATYSSIIPGVKIMKLVADPLNTLLEEREDNNVATRALIVGDAPDMARSFAGAISFNPSGFVSGDSVMVNFQVKNQGPQVGTAWVRFLVKDTTFATSAIDSLQFTLAPGASVTLSKRMYFDIDEGYVLTEIYNSSPLEFDLLNNNDTLRFTTMAKMKNAITINGNLDMMQAAPSELPGWIGGKILLGNYDLTVNGFILNYDATHFIISNGTGKLRLVNASTENVYPIGSSDTSRNFVRINNVGTADNFSVRVAEYVLLNGNSGDTVRLSNVDRTWFINEDVPGGSNATAEFWWSTNSELPGFDRLLCGTAHYTNLWEYGNFGPAVLASSGQYSRTQTGFTSFSPFTVTSGAGVVPLKLISFVAVNREDDVLLRWKTENEINTAGFTVERSADGVRFANIGNVAAFNRAGLHDYSLADRQPINGISYYRLKQTDTDGKFAYSNIIPISRKKEEKSITAFPNPVKDMVTVRFIATGEQRKLLVVDAKGVIVKAVIVSAGTNNVQINMSSFSKGIYNMVLQQGNTSLIKSVIKQ